MELTPNVKRLVIHKLSLDAIPPGGGLAAGVQFLSDPAKMKAGWQGATEWVEAALQALRQAPGPNPWAVASDEEIAGELLRRVEERKR